DVYSAAVSTQAIFSHVSQKHLILGFTALSTLLAMVVSIEQYETFLFLIGAIFVPLFGVVLTDYYVVKKRKYVEEILYTKQNKLGIGLPAIIAWIVGALL